MKEEEKKEYFQEMNRKMKFIGSGLELDPNMIQEEDTLREHFKLMLNASIGKFAQNVRPTTTKFIQTQV